MHVPLQRTLDQNLRGYTSLILITGVLDCRAIILAIARDDGLRCLYQSKCIQIRPHMYAIDKDLDMETSAIVSDTLLPVLLNPRKPLSMQLPLRLPLLRQLLDAALRQLHALRIRHRYPLDIVRLVRMLWNVWGTEHFLRWDLALLELGASFGLFGLDLSGLFRGFLCGLGGFFGAGCEQD